MDYKKELMARLSKYASRETIAGVMTALGMLESQATPEQWTWFGIAITFIFRVSKVLEKWLEVRAVTKANTTAKTEKVESVKDTQDTPTDEPSF
jgi:hypothetical protein